MRKLVFAIALLSAWGGAVATELVARNAGDELRLSSAACTNEGILSQIKTDYRDQFHGGSAYIKGVNYALCWVAIEGQAFVVYEDGDRGAYPLSAFKPVSSI